MQTVILVLGKTQATKAINCLVIDLGKAVL